jgi:hypothetical protein
MQSEYAKSGNTMNQSLQVICSGDLIHKRIHDSELIDFESPVTAMKSYRQISKRGLTTEHHS